MAWLAATTIALPGLLVDRFPVDLLLVVFWLTHQSAGAYEWLPRPRPGFLLPPWQTTGQ